MNSFLSGSSVALGAATLAENGTVGAVTINNAGAVIEVVYDMPTGDMSFIRLVVKD